MLIWDVGYAMWDVEYKNWLSTKSFITHLITHIAHHKKLIPPQLRL